MRPDPELRRPWPGLSEAICAEARARDEDGGFPAGAFRALRARGVVGRPPLEDRAIAELLALLALVGRGDLAVGRILEGHVNALLLVRTCGTDAQIGRYCGLAEQGELFGVWNTDAPDDPLRIEGGRLVGKKNFATGVDGLGHAVVTVSEPAGRRMIVAPLQGLAVDRAWWRPTGMRASGSHVVDFTGLVVDPAWMLGAPGDYTRQPWFSAGAIRFAAVQVGGAHGVFDAAVAHLRQAGRAGDAYQAHRLGRMGIAVECGYAWLDRAARAWSAAARSTDEGEGERAVAVANAARSAVEATALAILEDAERGVGVAGFLAPHPLELRMRDLRTYLRQPNPDGALAAVGDAIAEGRWAPGPPVGTNRSLRR